MNKNYVIEDGPKELCWYEYYKLVMDEYNALLIEKCDDEKAFQMFFENNDNYINIEALKNQKQTIIQPMNFQWEFQTMPIYVKHEAA